MNIRAHFPNLTGYSARPNPVKWLLIFSIALTFNLCSAHEALYYTAEIHLNDPELIQVHFSIHAPEMMLAADTDFSDIGDEWLAGLTDAEIETLIEKSREFVTVSYQLNSEKWNALAAFPLKFEIPDLIRKPDPENAPRPGCLIASMTFPNPGGELEFILSDKAEKRLLLAVIRPAAFPKTHDLQPGSIRKVTLPDRPPLPWYRKNWRYLIIVPFAFFMIAAIFRFMTSRRN